MTQPSTVQVNSGYYYYSTSFNIVLYWEISITEQYGIFTAIRMAVFSFIMVYRSFWEALSGQWAPTKIRVIAI